MTRHKIDSSMLPFGKPTIIRSPRHLAFVAEHGCAICGRRPVHVHHLTYGWPKARGRKAPDSLTAPLCTGWDGGHTTKALTVRTPGGMRKRGGSTTDWMDWLWQRRCGRSRLGTTGGDNEKDVCIRA